MTPADPHAWLRVLIPEADPEGRAELEGMLSAMESAPRPREATAELLDAVARAGGEASDTALAALAAAREALAASETAGAAARVRAVVAREAIAAAEAAQDVPLARAALARVTATEAADAAADAALALATARTAEARTAAAVAAAAMGFHQYVGEWQAKRAAAARADPILAALEAYRDVRELAESEHPGNAEHRAVTAALVAARDGGKPDPLAAEALADDGKRSQLAGELLGCARKVGELFGGEPPATDAEARATVDTDHGPALRWDAAFADLLDGMGGKRAGELADDVREAAAERTAAARSTDPPPGGDLWCLWAELEPAPGYAPRWLCLLAKALWADKWRPALVRERRPVALAVTGLLGVVTGALAGVAVQPGTDGRRVLVDREGRAVGRFEGPRLATAVQAEALEALALAGVRELRTVAAMRFVPWFAHAVQRRPDEAAALVFEGGDGVNAYGTVAAAMGMDPEKHAGEVRGLLHALNCAILSYPDGGEAGVLMLDYRPGGGRGNPSRLTLTPGRPWLAADVFELPEGSVHRALAPIPLLPDLAPPFVGDRRERGALGRLWLRILAELAHQSPDLARGLGAHIPGARWAELAREEGVLRPPPLLVELVQARWTRDADDGPAVFERVGPERWHLAPAFAAEREMLEAGGKQRIGASVGGKLAAKARAEARGRLADGMRGKGRR